VAIPSAATVHNAFGAAAFVRFYYAQLNAALRAASADPLTDLSDPECGTCKRYLASIGELADQRQHVKGTSVRVLSAEAPPEQNGYVAVDVFMDAPARTVVDANDQLVRAIPATARAHKTVFVRRIATGWTVRAVKDVP
jgi:hypothetical protein